MTDEERALLMFVANAALAIPTNLDWRIAHVDCEKLQVLIAAVKSAAEPKPSFVSDDLVQKCLSTYCARWSVLDKQLAPIAIRLILETAAPHLAAAKDAEIERLKKERDAAQENYESRSRASVTIARQRNAAEAVCRKVIEYGDKGGPYSTWVAMIADARAVLTREAG